MLMEYDVQQRVKQWQLRWGGVVLPDCKNLVHRNLNIDLNEPLLLLLSFDIR
jgi:hypothetical protein